MAQSLRYIQVLPQNPLQCTTKNNRLKIFHKIQKLLKQFFHNAGG